DRTGSLSPTHFGSDPSRTRGVHENARVAQFVGQNTGQRVQAGFRHAVRARATLHVVELAHAAGDVNDSPVAAAAHERDERLAQPPGAEQVRLQRRADNVQVGIDAVLPLVEVNTRVVHEDVEPAKFRLDPRGQPIDAGLVRHVELPGDNGKPRRRYRPGGRFANTQVAGREKDRDFFGGELPDDLQTDAAIGSAHQGDSG